MAEEGELLGGVRGLPEEGIVKRRSEEYSSQNVAGRQAYVAGEQRKGLMRQG